MNERRLIERYFRRPPAHGVVVGVGDDAAVLDNSARDERLVVTADTLVEGRRCV